MVSVFTPNINLEEPARGDDVGTWDTPVNSNTTLLDLSIGGFVAINLNNSPVILSTPQFQSRQIVFNSTLTGNVPVTFPSTFLKDYLVFNNCTGSSAFVVTLTCTAAGSRTVGIPPGEAVQVYNFANQGGLFFVNLGRVGGYWDYAGSSVPAWVTACSLPPYLPCDASAFSAVTYPVLAALLGGTVTPDRRGTAGYTLNQGTGRLTVASGGLDGDTRFATKTSDSVTIGTSNLPAYTPSGAFTGSPFLRSGGVVITVGASAGGVVDGVQPGTGSLSQPAITFNAQGGVSDALPAIGTGTVYGICMIRAA